MGESGKGIGATPRRYAIGYTQGTFDLFHAGHLRLIERAKAQCERLVAGVNSDLLVEQYKGRRTVVPQDERMAIIEALAAVDEVRLEDTLDKVSILSEIPFEAVFIGDDWRGHERWDAHRARPGSPRRSGGLPPLHRGPVEHRPARAPGTTRPRVTSERSAISPPCAG